MIPVIIITHGNICLSLLEAAENIIGRQEQVYTVAISAGEPVALVRERCEHIFQKTPTQEGLLVLADMVGGTPCNVMLSLLKEERAKVITGVNLYMVLNVLNARDRMDLPSLVQRALDSGKRSIVDASQVLARDAGQSPIAGS